jgi:uncharacterized membrane protein
MSPRTFALGLVVVLAAGAALRLYGLGTESLWLDEACSVWIAQQSVPELVEETAVDVHPPLYYLALHYWMQAAGTSEAAVRALSAVFGLAGIAAAALLTRRLFGPATALIAASVLAASPFHLYHSQQARMYALLALLATLSMHGFVALLQRRPRRWPAAAYVAATVLMLYTHVYALFVVIAQHAYVGALWIAARRSAGPFLRRWAVVHAVVAVAFVPWAVVLAQQFVRVEQGFWIARWPGWLLPYTFVVQAGSWWLAAVIVPLAALTGAIAWRSAIAEPPRTNVLRGASAEQWRVLLLALWFACPVLLPYMLSQVSTPIFLPKYTLLSAVALAMLAAHGVVLLGRRPVQVLAIAVLIAVGAVSVDAYYGKTHNDRWREAVAVFHDHAAPGDLVLFSYPWGQIPFDYYLARRDIVERALPPSLPALDRSRVASILETAASGHDRVWIVLSQVGELGAVVKEVLPAGFAPRLEHRVRGVQLLLFERAR